MIFLTPYREKTDADLVPRIHKGDKKAFKEILIRYQKSIYRFALTFLHDPHEAEDITQEVFLRLFCTPVSFDSFTSLRTFLFSITRNLCIDHLRKKRPEIMHDPPVQVSFRTPYDELCAFQLGEKINGVISTLPKNQRAAIYLRHVQGMTYREISDRLGVTIHAVESLLTRARRAFRNRFKP